jgi:hypothetical protein
MISGAPVLLGVVLLLLVAGSESASDAPDPPPLPPPAKPPQTQTAPRRDKPATYSPVEARATAQRVSDHLEAKGIAHYSHEALRIWQTLAGLVQDGIYGGSTRGALIFFGVPNPPPAFFRPTQTVQYTSVGKPVSSTRLAATSAPAARPATAAAPVRAPAAQPLGRAVQQQAAQPKPPAQPAGSVKASPELEPNHGSPPAGYSPATARSRAPAIASHLAKKGRAGYSRPELKSWQQQAGLHADGVYGGSSRGALIYFGVKDPPRPFFAPVATLPYVPPEQRA